jgi:hypothetical protein
MVKDQRVTRGLFIAFCATLCVVASTMQRTMVVETARARSVARHVAIYGNDRGDCTDARSPCRTVQYAVDRASSGDLIKVAAGVYTDLHAYEDGRLVQVIHLTRNVAIRGGYPAFFADPPDPVAYPTVFDARRRGRVIYVSSYRGATTAIDGVHITGGDATGLGGGPWNEDTGGGVYVDGAPVLITNSQVYSNTAYMGGGVAAIEAQLVMRGNHVLRNTAPYGAGLFLYGGSGSLESNSVVSNTARVNGGGMYILRSHAELTANPIRANAAWYGGGVFLEESGATFLGNTIQANEAMDMGLGGGVYAQECTLSFVRNMICDNVAGWGGGLSLFWNHDAFEGNYILRNSASVAGGGLLTSGSETMLTNTVVADNEAGRGSGFLLDGTSVTMQHTTVARNKPAAQSQGAQVVGVGLYIGTGYSRPSEVVLTNTILVSHSLGVTVEAGSTAQLEATLWGTGMWANGRDWAGDGIIFTGTVNVRGEPRFLAPDGTDYHIGLTSAARDQGVSVGVPLDIDQQPRPYRAPDLGADEYWPGDAPWHFYLPLVLQSPL